MRVIIYGQILIDMVTKGAEHHIKCIEGLPEGTMFRYATNEPLFGIAIVVEHQSFKDLKEGDEIPIFPRPEINKL
jgi:hypothetical protein